MLRHGRIVFSLVSIMQNQLKRAMELAKKTGDRLIVFDNVKSSEPYVVLSIDEYERLMIKKSDVRGLTEEELLDKINRDIAVWKSEQEFFNEYLEKDEYGEEMADSNEADLLEDELEEEFYFEPEEYKNFETKVEKFGAESLLDGMPEEMPGTEDTGGEKSASGERKYFYGPFTEEEINDPAALSSAVQDGPKKWTIPTDRKKAADEVIEEDKNYLEEIGEMPY